MRTISTTAAAGNFTHNVGDAVSDFVAGLQRINARRVARRSPAQVTAIGVNASDTVGRCYKVSIPQLSSGFAYAAWLG